MTLISGDAPGVVAAYLEKKLGATVLFVNGAAGNTAPDLQRVSDPSRGHLSEFRVLLGDRILEANRGFRRKTRRHHASLWIEIFVESPLKPGLEWPAELARYSRIGFRWNALGAPARPIP